MGVARGLAWWNCWDDSMKEFRKHFTWTQGLTMHSWRSHSPLSEGHLAWVLSLHKCSHESFCTSEFRPIFRGSAVITPPLLWKFCYFIWTVQFFWIYSQAANSPLDYNTNHMHFLNTPSYPCSCYTDWYYSRARFKRWRGKRLGKSSIKWNADHGWEVFAVYH